LPIDSSQSLPTYEVEAGLACVETVEAISAAGEGAQIFLEGVGEQLGGIGEHLDNIIIGL
jgi:hypothetical protein